MNVARARSGLMTEELGPRAYSALSARLGWKRGELSPTGLVLHDPAAGHEHKMPRLAQPVAALAVVGAEATLQ